MCAAEFQKKQSDTVQYKEVLRPLKPRLELRFSSFFTQKGSKQSLNSA